MKTSTKIWLILFIITSIGLAFTSVYIFSALKLVPSGVKISMTTASWIGVVLLVINTISLNILFIRFLKSRKFNTMLFFSTVPTSLIFGFIVYSLTNIEKKADTKLENVVKVALKIDESNSNKIYWLILAVIIYIFIMFVVFSLASRPIKKVEKACSKLCFGEMKNRIVIGGNKDFKEIEYSLNKINENYKKTDMISRPVNLQQEKFIPKDIISVFNKKSFKELEIGDKKDCEVATMLCFIKNTHEFSQTLTLKENFNYINSYLNLVTPLIKKYNGFVDKFIEDGLVSVFNNPDNAYNCAMAINKFIKNKNIKDSIMPNLEACIGINFTKETLGIIGNDHEKQVVVISDYVNDLIKMQEVNKKYETKMVMSKEYLNSLSNKIIFSYRFIGNITTLKDYIIPIFENLSVYSNRKKDKLEKYKTNFEEGVRLYNNAKFKEAKLIFLNVYKKEKEDKVCYIYYNKCLEKEEG